MELPSFVCVAAAFEVPGTLAGWLHARAIATDVGTTGPLSQVSEHVVHNWTTSGPLSGPLLVHPLLAPS